jgi:hypothetical protein
MLSCRLTAIILNTTARPPAAAMACDAASAAMRCMLCLWRMDMTRRRYRPEVEGSESRFSVSPIRAAADQSTDPLGLPCRPA